MRGLAAAVPLLVGVALWAVLDAALHASAGRVGDTIAARLADGVGDVVLIGNSVSAKGIDGEALGAKLGTRVTDLAIDGTLPPHWYAVLEHGVFEHGGRPRLVVLYANMGAMTTTALATDEQRATYVLLDGADDPVTAGRAFPGGATLVPLRALLGARFVVRDAITGVVVHGAAALGEPHGPGALLATGTARVREAEEALFGVSAASRKASPGEGPPAAPDAQGSVDDSLLPDLAARCREAGARLVLVLSAARPDHRRACGDPSGAADLLAGVVAGGPVDVLLLDTLAVPAASFSDAFHLRAGGRAMATEALADALDASGVARKGATAPGTVWDWPCASPPPLEALALAAADGAEKPTKPAPGPKKPPPRPKGAKPGQPRGAGVGP